jgi:hypothetical protein
MGRRQSQAPEAVWRKRLARFETSKTTVAEFCRLEGVSIANFYQWRKRLLPATRNAKQVHASKPREAGKRGLFVPVTVSSPTLAEVEFPNGMRVRVPANNTEALRAVILAGNELSREAPRC